MKLTKLQQIIAGVVIVIFVAALAHFVVLKGDRQSIVSTDLEIDRLTSEINVAKAIQQTAAVLQEEMIHLKAQLDRLKKILPVTVNEPKFLADIKRFANENGIEVRALSNNRPVTDDVIVEHPFSFITRGNYHDYGAFFAELTNYQRIINVKALHLYRNVKDVSYSVDGSFIISVFTYNEPTEAELRKQMQEKKRSKRKRR